MSAPVQTPSHLGVLLGDSKDVVIAMMRERLVAAGYGDIRPAHGCVFRFIDPVEGSRLTDLAVGARMTKQAVGEVITDLEALGYVERTPDASDGRAKIVRLTEKGQESTAAALEAFAAVEAELADRFGERRISDLRELLAEISAAR